MAHGKYTYEYVFNEFKDRDYELISKEYKNCLTKLKYICNKHRDKGIQEITFTKFHNCHQGCYYCGREVTEKAHMINFDKTEDKKLCDSKNFTYIDTIRKNGKITISFICNNHKKLGLQYMTKANMERNIKGCKYCSGKDLPEWYVLEEAERINPNIKILEPYTNLTTRMKCICVKHNYPTSKSMQEILKGQGCYYCGCKKLSDQSFLTLEEYQNKVSLKNENIKVLEYNGSHNDAKFECLLCGHIWNSNSQSIRQCPNCMNYYTGEKKISEFLNSINIPYIAQYRFDDCKDKRSLPFDFYLYENNICIEFDGLQHYEQRNGWTDLGLIQYHDKIKNNYCKMHDIRLIRIPYWEQQNIENILFNKLIQYKIIEEIQTT